jgi:hypothetical protein
MQSSTFNEWRDVLVYLAGVLTVGIPTAARLYLDYKKTSSERKEAEARIELTKETTESIRIRDSMATGEGVGRMLTALIDTGERFTQIQERMFELEQDQLELKMARQDIRQLKGLLDAHGIPYSEKDKSRTLPKKDNVLD